MDGTMPAPAASCASLRWAARLSSILISGMFLLILFLAFTNEDRPAGFTVGVMVLLVLAIVGCSAAWKWERAGGVAVVVGALCLGVAALASSLASGLGYLSLVSFVMYGAPFFVVGALFWVSGKEHAC